MLCRDHGRCSTITPFPCNQRRSVNGRRSALRWRSPILTSPVYNFSAVARRCPARSRTTERFTSRFLVRLSESRIGSCLLCLPVCMASRASGRLREREFGIRSASAQPARHIGSWSAPTRRNFALLVFTALPARSRRTESVRFSTKSSGLKCRRRI